MKTNLALASLALAMLPSALFAAPVHKATSAKKTSAAVTYQCSKCHMAYSAVQAKKYYYHDPMDGGALVPVVPKTKQ